MLSTVVLSNENQTCRGWEAPTSIGGEDVTITRKPKYTYWERGRKDMIDNKRQELIHSQVMEILKENQLAFSNVARPKPTKASTATSASWSKDLAPKASAATQGAWDSTNTPGGVSSLAKEKWNVQEIAALVTKALEASNVKVAFSNKPIPAPTTISSSTQPAWKKDEDEAPRKPAAGTSAPSSSTMSMPSFSLPTMNNGSYTGKVPTSTVQKKDIQIPDFLRNR